MLEQGLGEDHPRLAWLLSRLALQLTRDGQIEAAEVEARRALALAGGIEGLRGGPDAAAILVHLGVADRELEAEWQAFRARQPGDHDQAQPLCLRLARLQDLLGEASEAEAWRRQCSVGAPTASVETSNG